MQKTLAVIPARYASTRFPGKPLIDIAGKTMIERVYRQVKKAAAVQEVIVATDDERIAEVVKHFGGLVKGDITRYELPRVEALNFVLENSLGGGVTRSLSLDPHGKSYGALILTMPVTVDDQVAARLLAQGRTPLP